MRDDDDDDDGYGEGRHMTWGNMCDGIHGVKGIAVLGVNKVICLTEALCELRSRMHVVQKDKIGIRGVAARGVWKRVEW